MLSPAAECAMSRISTLTRCLDAVGDLMIPEQDLSVVDRDGVACLIAFLAKEYEVAQRSFRQAMQPQ